MLVEYNADENLSSGLTKDGIEFEMIDIYETIFTSGEDISYGAVSAYLPLVDQFGSESVDVAYETRLDGKVGARINWENAIGLDFDQLWDVLFAIQEFQ